MATRNITGKAQVIDLVHQELHELGEGLAKRDVSNVVDTLCDCIMQSIVDGDEVNLPPLGKFEAKHRPSRQARNPQTGETVMTQDKWVPRFKPSKQFKDALT